MCPRLCHPPTHPGLQASRPAPNRIWSGRSFSAKETAQNYRAVLRSPAQSVDYMETTTKPPQKTKNPTGRLRTAHCSWLISLLSRLPGQGTQQSRAFGHKEEEKHVRPVEDLVGQVGGVLAPPVLGQRSTKAGSCFQLPKGEAIFGQTRGFSTPSEVLRSLVGNPKFSQTFPAGSALEVSTISQNSVSNSVPTLLA